MKVTYLNCDSKNDDKSDYRNYEHHLGSSEHKAWNYSSLYESRMLDLCDASAAMSGLEFCLLKLELKRKVDWIRTFFNKAIDGKDPISRALTSEQKLNIKSSFPILVNVVFLMCSDRHRKNLCQMRCSRGPKTRKTKCSPDVLRARGNC